MMPSHVDNLHTFTTCARQNTFSQHRGRGSRAKTTNQQLLSRRIFTPASGSALLPCLQLCCCRFEQHNPEFDNGTHVLGAGYGRVFGFGQHLVRSRFGHTTRAAINTAVSSNKQTATPLGVFPQTNNYSIGVFPQTNKPQQHMEDFTKQTTTTSTQSSMVHLTTSSEVLRCIAPPAGYYSSWIFKQTTTSNGAPYGVLPSTRVLLPTQYSFSQTAPDRIRPDQTRPDSTIPHGSCTDASLRGCDPTIVSLPGPGDIGIEHVQANGESHII
ncbi:hypothetical protein V8C44DRAFT_150648 [Trichoderma aethiopicum]